MKKSSTKEELVNKIKAMNPALRIWEIWEALMSVFACSLANACEPDVNVRNDREKEFERALYNDDSFSLWNYRGDYYGTTYHALSFDVDHCFVVLKSAKMVTIEGKRVPHHCSYYDSPSFDDIQIFLNELNILFTRGRESLNICINDIETYLYFNNLIGKIK